MKGLAMVYAMFAAGVGLSIGQHEASIWPALWRALIFPGIAGYQFAIYLFHYSH